MPRLRYTSISILDKQGAPECGTWIFEMYDYRVSAVPCHPNGCSECIFDDWLTRECQVLLYIDDE